MRVEGGRAAWDHKFHFALNRAHAFRLEVRCMFGGGDEEHTRIGKKNARNVGFVNH